MVISVIDIQLFELQKITPKQMFINEFSIFLIGFISAFLVFIAGVVLTFKKQWKQCCVATLNVSVFFICFFIAMRNGVALVYAT